MDVQDHRPWPLPAGPWLMGQTWSDLAFLHWRVEPEVLRPRVPAGVELDVFDGSAWLGVTPFRLEHLRIRGTLPVPRLSSFLETNVRTYVTAGDKAGIWFFSLDAESPVAVEAARRLYKLPYFRARMAAWPRGDVGEDETSAGGRRERFPTIEYETSRRDRSGHLAELRVTYGPRGDAFAAEPGTLEHFLTERYCLYATDDDARLHRAEIHHPPWSLQRGEAEIAQNTMPPPGIELGGVGSGEPAGSGGAGSAGAGAGRAEEPHVLFSKRQDAVIWAPARV